MSEQCSKSPLKKPNSRIVFRIVLKKSVLGKNSNTLACISCTDFQFEPFS